MTKIRWPVESVHGILGQKFRILHHQFRNLKAACYFLNENGKRLYSDAGKLEKIIEVMKERFHKKNTLADEVDACNYNQKTVPFRQITS